jgi:hypothetical protein
MFERCEDFLGMRMVCNKLQDVHRAADLGIALLGDVFPPEEAVCGTREPFIGSKF